jgi:hypothetical protein
MLWWSMKSNVVYNRGETWINDLEGLNSAIQVHVKDGILIVPHTRIWPCYLVTDEKDPVITWIRLNLIDCGAGSCPRLDSRLHSDGRIDRRKGEKGRAAANRKLTIGEIVKHVALPGMRLAPGVFMRANIGRFAKITGSRICPRSQVSHVNQDPVRHAVMVVAGVVVGV